MLGKDEILRTLSQHQPELRAFGVARLGLFGSFARGEARPDSDLDFVVDLKRRTFDDFMGLKIFLEDLFGRRVDLVLFDRIKPQLEECILREVVDAPGF